MDQATGEAVTYRPHLDGLRTVAVYLVLVFHAGADRLSGGFIGVDVFFVLSGYLVTQVVLRELWGQPGRLATARFYARRVRRLLPAAVVTLLVTAAVFRLVASPAEVRDVEDSFRAAFLYVANWHFIASSTDYFAAELDTNPVVHFWSLSIEEQFYAFWPLALIGLTAVRRRFASGDRIVRGLTLGLAAASALWALHLATSNLDRAYYGSDARAYQLLVGAFLAMSPMLVEGGGPAGPTARRNVAIAAVGGLLCLGFLATSFLEVGPITRGILVTAVTAGLLVALERSSPQSPARRLLATAPMTYLGRISYGTYLWHWPVIVVLARVLPMGPLATAAVTFAVATGLAAVSAQLLELPIRTSRALQRPPRLVAVLGVTSSVLVGLFVLPVVLEPEGAGAARVTTDTEVVAIGTGSDTVDWEAASEDIAEELDCFEAPVEQCADGPQEGRRVLLIGDSHGIMMRPAWEEIAEEHGYALTAAAVNGCVWQIGLASEGQTVQEREHCFDVQRDWYERVIPEVDPDLLVVIERAIDDPDRPVVSVGDDWLPADASQAELHRLSWERTRDTLDDLDVPTVVLESIPVVSFERDPLECLSTGVAIEACRYVITMDPTPLETQYRAAADDDFASVNIDTLVCPFAPICDPVVDDMVVKWDDTHLTTTYARAIAPRIAAAIDDTGMLP
jgi:peptidoglycan/LPS O-acetylase OafA/YrhL